MNYKISIITPHQRQTETFFIQSDKFKFDVLKCLLPTNTNLMHVQKLTAFTDRYYAMKDNDLNTIQSVYVTELLPEEAARIEQWTLIPR